MAKRQIYTCASYGEGCSLEKPNDCLRAARQCLSRWWSTCQSSPTSVPSLSVCLLASLPHSFFLLSLFLPPLFHSPSLLPASCLFSLALFLSSAEPHLLQFPWSCAFLQPFPRLSPEWTHPLTLSTSENKRVFVSMSLYHTSPFTHMLDRQIDNTHAHTHTHRRRELWSGFVYDGERQYRDCFRVVSSREMYRCQECVLYVWALGWSHFGKQKISYRMTSSGIKVNYQL